MSPDSAPDRYRRRRYWPALTVIAVLLVGAAIVWFPSLRPNPENSSACNAPGPAPATTAPTTRSVSVRGPVRRRTDATAAAPHRRRRSTAASPADRRADRHLAGRLRRPREPGQRCGRRTRRPSLLRVYNSSSVRGQAKAVTDELRAAGFESILAGANDPLYPAADLRCVAQIRFGPAGAAAARTVLLVAPVRTAGGRHPGGRFGRSGAGRPVHLRLGQRRGPRRSSGRSRRRRPRRP